MFPLRSPLRNQELLCHSKENPLLVLVHTQCNSAPVTSWARSNQKDTATPDHGLPGISCLGLQGRKAWVSGPDAHQCAAGRPSWVPSFLGIRPHSHVMYLRPLPTRRPSLFVLTLRSPPLPPSSPQKAAGSLALSLHPTKRRCGGRRPSHTLGLCGRGWRGDGLADAVCWFSSTHLLSYEHYYLFSQPL